MIDNDNEPLIEDMLLFKIEMIESNLPFSVAKRREKIKVQ